MKDLILKLSVKGYSNYRVKSKPCYTLLRIIYLKLSPRVRQAKF